MNDRSNQGLLELLSIIEIQLAKDQSVSALYETKFLDVNVQDRSEHWTCLAVYV